MALNSVIGALRVNLGLNSAAFAKGLTSSEKQLKTFQRNLNRMGQNIQAFGTRLSVGLTLPLTALAGKSISAAKKQQAAVAQVEAALASMGNQAGFTSKQLQDMASSLQGNSLFGDEDILNKVTANLLTFGNIAEEQFTRAQKLALDLSARLDQDLKSSAIQLGKALNDPVKGISALSEVGVAFTAQQKEVITALAETGRVAEAQRLILSELEKQYAGQAEAIAKLDAGRITQSFNRIGDAMERVGEIILPVIASIVEKVADIADAFARLDPKLQTIIVSVGALAAALGPLTIGAGLLVTSFAALAPILPGIVVAFAAMTGPIGIVAAVIGTAAAGIALFGKNAKGAEQPIYDASDAMATLNGDLRTFYQTGAPSAGKAAIDLANDYVKLAEKAYDAAEAQLANNRATLEAARRASTIRQSQTFGTTIGDVARDGVSGQELDSAKDVEAALKDLARAERDLAEARRAQRRTAAAVTGATYDYADSAREAAEETTVVVDGLEDLNRVGGGSGGAVSTLDDLADAADTAADSLGGVGDALSRAVDAFRSGGLSSAIDSLRSSARGAFGDLISDSFGGGGGFSAGIGNLFSNLGQSISDGFSQIRSVFAGGGLSALSSAIGSFLPVIGAFGALSSLVKGLFGSKQIIGKGFQIGVEDGLLTGGEFTTTKSKKLFGLIKSTKTRVIPFDAEGVQTGRGRPEYLDDLATALNTELEGVRFSVGAIFKSLGEDVSEAAIKAVEFSTRFDTRGLSEEEVQEKFAEAFADYGDAISRAIGGIGLEAAVLLAQVTATLRPAGQLLFGSLQDMADAAENLAGRFGGADNLASSVAAFVDSFFTETEKFQILTDNVAGVFDSLNIAVPKTNAAFKELVLAQNLMTEAGRETYAALLQIAPQFNAITGASTAFGAFDFGNKRFDTAFEEQIFQIAQARNYDLDQLQQLGGSAFYDPESPISLLDRIADTLDRMEVNGIPER